jgi:hypothetical protein
MPPLNIQRNTLKIENRNITEESDSLGIKEIKDLIEKIKNGQVNDARTTDNIAQAEEWQNDGLSPSALESVMLIFLNGNK